MALFYIDTYDHIAVIDDVGTELPDIRAVRALVQRSLAEIVAEQVDRRAKSEIHAVVRDADGQQVMIARMAVAIDWSEGNGTR